MEIKYIIFYENDYVTLLAKDTKDCIIKFAEYIDGKDDLFEKAIIGCDLHKDCVNLYNRMHPYTHIREINIIARTIFRDDIDGK